MPETPRRGDEVRRPTGWIVRAVDLRAAKGWAQLVNQARANADRAWVAITADPRCREDPARQHPLKYDLGRVKVGGVECEQWQFEVTGGGRVWYAIDDSNRTLWITQAGTGHPKQTDRRR
ncbi:hypothetical protein [Nocardia sp. SSK8]|uniref:hypothetical protein n=1 Tax=Nocardia sp. SSK8 TaxID=3120154 RepID=UPI00300BCD50